MNRITVIPTKKRSMLVRGVRGNSTFCEQAENILLAKELIELGAKTTLVHQLLSIEKGTVLRLYREITGNRASPGPSSYNGAWIQRSYHRMGEATFIWQLFLKLSASTMTKTRKLILIFSIYRQYYAHPQLSINHIFDVLRLMEANVWKYIQCPECKTWHLESGGGRHHRCPACSLYARNHCSVCGDITAYKPEIPRQTRCNACRKAGKFRYSTKKSNHENHHRQQ